MNTIKRERRRCERIIFSDNDGIRGILKIQSDQEKMIAVHIMDLGEEGMGIALERHTQVEQLHEEELVVLTEFQGPEKLRFLLNVEMAVKWTLDLEYIAAGCEFVNTSESFRDQIREAIHCWCK